MDLPLSDIWGQRRDSGADFSADLASIVTSNVDYLCDNVYPYIQVINYDAVFSAETKIKFVTSPTGWTIQDYGEATSTSVPHKDPEGDAHVVKQGAIASEIAKIIATKGWAKAEIISGSPLMNKLLWIESKRYGFKILGYKPTPEDEKTYKNLEKFSKENGIPWEKQAVKAPKKDEPNIGAAWAE